MLHGAIHVKVVQTLEQLVLQFVTEPAQAFRLGRHFFSSNFAGLAQPDNTRDVEGSRPHAAFVAATVNLRGDLHARIATTDVKGATTLRAVELMAGQGEAVDIHGVHIDRNLTYSLYGIGMKDDIVLTANLANLSDRLHHSNFVVCEHD